MAVFNFSCDHVQSQLGKTSLNVDTPYTWNNTELQKQKDLKTT